LLKGGGGGIVNDFSYNFAKNDALKEK